MKFLTCQNCSKKLLKADGFNRLSVKCRHCKQINLFTSVTNAAILGKSVEAHEAQTINGDPRGKTLQQSTSAIYRAET
jgi:phage FluMu protein Com